MPELPEVETVRIQLEREVVGAVIDSIEIRKDKIFLGEPTQIIKQKIQKIERVGKYLFIFFESGVGVVIHLKMTGRLVIKSLNHYNIKPLEIDYETAKHTRIVITLGDGRKIFYWDTRMFGYIKTSDALQVTSDKLKQKMGPEPWEITDKELMGVFKKTGRSIKDVILDQHILAGIGNIYANDGLWLAGIDPRRKARSLQYAEIAKLRVCLCKVLERGLRLGGASDNTYRDLYGGRGGYQNEFLVYGRTGESCNKCGNLLKRIVVSGRGTWVCEKCQH